MERLPYSPNEDLLSELIEAAEGYMSAPDYDGDDIAASLHGIDGTIQTSTGEYMDVFLTEKDWAEKRLKRAIKRVKDRV